MKSVTSISTSDENKNGIPDDDKTAAKSAGNGNGSKFAEKAFTQAKKKSSPASLETEIKVTSDKKQSTKK